MFSDRQGALRGPHFSGGKRRVDEALENVTGRKELIERLKSELECWYLPAWSVGGVLVRTTRLLATPLGARHHLGPRPLPIQALLSC